MLPSECVVGWMVEPQRVRRVRGLLRGIASCSHLTRQHFNEFFSSEHRLARLASSQVSNRCPASNDIALFVVKTLPSSSDCHRRWGTDHSLRRTVCLNSCMSCAACRSLGGTRPVVEESGQLQQDPTKAIRCPRRGGQADHRATANPEELPIKMKLSPDGRGIVQIRKHVRNEPRKSRKHLRERTTIDASLLLKTLVVHGVRPLPALSLLPVAPLGMLNSKRKNS